MNKSLELKKIADQIARCKICKKGKSGKAVPGEGNSDANVVFIGEAPGKNEAKSGRPFIGRSGKLLRNLIKESGLKDNEVYITSSVKYLPDYGIPTRLDIEHGKVHLDKQLEIIHPKIIVLLGNVAAKALIEDPLFVTKDHGKIIRKDGRKYLLTFHPAAVIRFPKYKHAIVSDFKKLQNILSMLK